MIKISKHYVIMKKLSLFWIIYLQFLYQTVHCRLSIHFTLQILIISIHLGNLIYLVTCDTSDILFEKTPKFWCKIINFIVFAIAAVLLDFYYYILLIYSNVDSSQY